MRLRAAFLKKLWMNVQRASRLRSFDFIIAIIFSAAACAVIVYGIVAFANVTYLYDQTNRAAASITATPKLSNKPLSIQHQTIRSSLVNFMNGKTIPFELTVTNEWTFAEFSNRENTLILGRRPSAYDQQQPFTITPLSEYPLATYQLVIQVGSSTEGGSVGAAQAPIVMTNGQKIMKRLSTLTLDADELPVGDVAHYAYFYQGKDLALMANYDVPADWTDYHQSVEAMLKTFRTP